jgi:hypothetical protein
MAWQAPKTNWTGADGVRDSDLNRIEGNILHLYGNSVASNHTIHVSTTGSDANGAGTSASPYATITKALSVLPKNLNGRTVIINVSTGIYEESVVIRDFYGGTLQFSGSSIVNINNLEIRNCTLHANSVDFVVSGSVGVLVTDGATLITTGDINSSSSTIGLSVTNCSAVHVGGNVTLNGMTTGIAATNNSRAFVFSINGSNIGTIITASNGAVVAYGSNDATARTAISATSTGGRINTGSQTGTTGGGVL